MVHLIVDTRERAVIALIEAAFGLPQVKAYGFTYGCAQIQIGDYFIVGNKPGETTTTPMCCIERKTLSDFAASLHDGRFVNNTQKMIDYRKSNPGCRLLYIVENTSAFHADTSTFGRYHVPYKQIKNAIDTLICRDDIHVVLTKNQEGTVEKIIDYMCIYDRLIRFVDIPDPRPVENAEDLLEIMHEQIEPITGAEYKGLVKELTTPIPKTMSNILVSFWSKLPGITIITAESIIFQCSILEYIRNPTIYHITQKDGKAISPTGKASLAKLVGGDREIQIRCLSSIERVTVDTASLIVDRCGTLLGITPELLGTVRIKYGSSTRALSKDVIERVMVLLNFKIGMPEPDFTKK